nr:uncharacterized protein LOC117454265 [Pseudochaenichthys georgianus]
MEEEEKSLPNDAVSTAHLEKTCREAKQAHVLGVQAKDNATVTSVRERTEASEDQCLLSSNKPSSVSHKTFCYICGKPQSKCTRHLKTHEKTSVDVAQALALPKDSKERKKMLNKLRNKGNYEHNKEVLTSGSGLLKLRRKSKKEYDSKDYVHCMYRQALYLRRDLWRHVRICSLKPAEANAPGVWKMLTAMKSDDISAAVRSDFCILQLAQSFFKKHGQDPTKYDYIRQKLREVGRLLLTLRKEFSIQTLEDAVRPANFHVVICAVKRVSGFKEEKHFCQTPSLALKLGHSLRKICDIIHCRALMAEDSELIKSIQTFQTPQSGLNLSHTQL